MIAFRDLPGLPPLFLDFLQGKARDFFPDSPDMETAAARAREIVSGTAQAVVTGGQQAGLFTGPLYCLTKAFSLARVARELSARGVSARGSFWTAEEDHDLAEAARATVMIEGAPKTFRLDDSTQKNFAPAGLAIIPEAIEKIFHSLRAEGAAQPDLFEMFETAWRPGRTLGEAFRQTMEQLTQGSGVEILSPLEPRFLDGRLEFFRRALEIAPLLTASLKETEQRLRAAGYEPQVARGKDDFPGYLIEAGVRRKISFDGTRFALHGHDRQFTAKDLFSFTAENRMTPSPAALLRPVLAASLFPVAAQVLGPAEIAYHAQVLPLFTLFGLRPPVLLPRPHLYPRGAKERRAMEALNLPEGDLFRLSEAVAGAPPAVAGKVRQAAGKTVERLREIAPEIGAVDKTLVAVATRTAESLSAQAERLAEKIERAAERRDLEKNRRVELIGNWLAPGGTPPDRVYTPLTYLLRFGKALLTALADAADCSVDGARFVDFE